MKETDLIGTIALLLQLGCEEEYLDAVLATLSGHVIPHTPTEMLRVLRDTIDLERGFA